MRSHFSALHKSQTTEGASEGCIYRRGKTEALEQLFSKTNLLKSRLIAKP